VGMKGVRIQAIVRELEGEKIDILKYSIDPREFIKNALSPAEVQTVILLDEAKKQALAVVEESQLSLAIGKQGLNVRLANRLVDWNIDVKTEAQFEEMDISAETKKAVSALFSDIEEEEEITKISELPGISERLAELLRQNGIELIETLVSMSGEELSSLEGLTPQDAQTIQSIINESVEIIEEEPAVISQAETSTDETESQVESYECPECGAAITIDMTTCPNCGVGLSFEVEEDPKE
ncbi:MAG: helix-hairpin-helix domain-containing protein, partial [Spirochaetota bacterium]